jgi:hypothetical protein
MEDETFFAKLVHLLVFLAICAAIIIVGWHEPLRFRFMSPEEIVEETRADADRSEPPKSDSSERPKWFLDSRRRSRLDDPPVLTRERKPGH